MYHYSSGPGYSFMASPAAPPRAKGLRDDLAEMTRAHFYVNDRESVDGYLDALKSSTAPDIDLARIQIQHAIGMVHESLMNKASLTRAADFAMTVRTIVDGVASDLRDLAKACDASPRNKSVLRQYAGAVLFISEAAAFLDAYAEIDNSEEIDALHGEVATLANAAVKALGDFRSSVGNRYAEVTELLTEPEAVWIHAVSSLDNGCRPVPHFSPEDIDRAKDDCGSRDILWAVAHSEDKRSALIDSGRYTVLTESEAFMLRDRAIDILGRFNETFNQTGFVATLRQIAGAARYLGGFKINSCSASDDAIAAGYRLEAERLKSGYVRYRSKEEIYADLAKDIANIPQNREQFRKEGMSLLAFSSLIDNALLSADRHLRPQEQCERTIVFRNEDGVIVGRESDRDDGFAILVYDDQYVRDHTKPDAVYVAKLPAGRLSHGIPPLVDVKAAGFPGTNYRSLEDFMDGIDTFASQAFLFGERVLVVRDDAYSMSLR